MGATSAAVARRGAALSSVVALLLVGATPAHAESVRSRQWHLDVMRAEQMWKTSTGKNVTVAVIDSGVDASVPDLQGRVLKGKDLATDSPGDERTDYKNHGTGIAGIIAGTGNAGGRDGAFGLAPGSKILPIRVKDSVGKVNGATGDRNFNDDVSAAIRFAVDQGAKVINISLGNNVGSQRLTDSVRYALDEGVLIFAAAGNSGDKENAIEYPSGTPGVVGVGSVGRDLRRAKSSQYGPQVDLAAPGVDTVHACSGGTQLCESSGTSYATAVASASAALIWSKHPDWTNNQVLRVMLNTAGGPVSGKKRSDGIGYGIVRPRIALKTPGDPGPADVYPLPDLAAAASEAGGGADQSEAPAAAAADGGGSSALWIGLGVAAAALVGGGVTAAVLRSRRRKAVAAQPPTAYQPPYGYGQPQFQPPYPPTAPPPGAPENTSH
ncbi:type VII secretion-associated serine protease mycosin [Streptomyces fimicarius]|uniref:type VII secretion-associated serine protease mycosin n=1 Tax=Streptomyces TaxID=1883 RepID=UPI0009972D43|nr:MULTISPECIES: type VII secretion-associated serine protease mycosin [Streptomyces]MCX4709152.1 type VII secretion-associated serine protease mycosin [Streptomyces griseus]QXQ97156.1 type VII secretion-associated serine protease mycosin [Streptomyces sp. WY228]